MPLRTLLQDTLYFVLLLLVWSLLYLKLAGKLNEPAFSEDGSYRLPAHFHNAASRVENAPHPLAKMKRAPLRGS